MLITHRGLSARPAADLELLAAGDPLRIDLLPRTDALESLWSGSARSRRRNCDGPGRCMPKRFAQRFCELLAPSRRCASNRHENCVRSRTSCTLAHHTQRHEGYRTGE